MLHSFLWLGVAAFIDVIDGPLARKVKVEQLLPRFSGARLDLVVDYLNFCVVPAFIIMESKLAGEGYGLFSGAVILLSSLFHFADIYSKTEDGFFVGFPTLWNVVCLYFFYLRYAAGRYASRHPDACNRNFYSREMGSSSACKTL